MKELDARDWDQRDLYSIKRFCAYLIGPLIGIVYLYWSAGVSAEATGVGVVVGLLLDIPIMFITEVV